MDAEWAVSVAPPPRLRALLLLELTARPQATRLTSVVPFPKVEALAPVSRARTQSLPATPCSATARAEMVGPEARNRLENSAVCGCWTMTSTAEALALKLPVAGGLLTVTVVPAAASVKPYLAAAALASAAYPALPSRH